MSNPYQSPNTDSSESDEFVKLVGIELRKKKYVLIQAILIGFLSILGVSFLLMTGSIFGFKLWHVGIGCLVLAILEGAEAAYAIKYKSYTK